MNATLANQALARLVLASQALARLAIPRLKAQLQPRWIWGLPTQGHQTNWLRKVDHLWKLRCQRLTKPLPQDSLQVHQSLSCQRKIWRPPHQITHRKPPSIWWQPFLVTSSTRTQGLWSSNLEGGKIQVCNLQVLNLAISKILTNRQTHQNPN